MKNIKVGDKFTVIGSGSMGSTYRQEVYISREMTGERFGMKIRDNRSKRLGRKEFFFTPKKDELIFAGWDLEIDSNVNENYGSGGCITFTLVGGGLNVINKYAPESVSGTREWIEKNNLNEEFTAQKYLELHFQGKKLARLYPELQTA